MYALEINGLAKTFKGKKFKSVEALKGLHLSIERGEVLGFLGPNGAGKSTTIKCLMGLIRPSAGSAKILGRDTASADARKVVGYLPENPAFYDYLSAEEYLRFVGRVHQVPAPLLAQRVAEMLKLLELWDARKRLIRSYSKGMVQRVGLAQVLVHDPEVYILDEPMSGLDPIGRALVKDIILDLKRRGKCVFFSTHITDDVEKVCDRVAVIDKGELLAVDRVENILQRGVEGYTVYVTTPDGHSEEVYVEKAALQSFLQQTVSAKQVIEKIEPRRKDMEAFFLELVSK
ncbi:ABC transporter, ATP-binding protein [Citrifermentans bemidjiense Bem]|uniref:ABC transporter, ATP-binding protein n=1 Tax=Citrifermentans bemidjiense (strain ATCC BAA-1014 / DSM 16622 / JCM 12645 / Bem) TaxID=404380 RepID=B5EGW1_CITBB|nr:ABC transporter ATP-binding protein [Citrifermentans bemidjiense]ACH39594.1 ABC transporter, ATP-binding protein [Citrifermentans bemidjiense Bem]